MRSLVLTLSLIRERHPNWIRSEGVCGATESQRPFCLDVSGSASCRAFRDMKPHFSRTCREWHSDSFSLTATAITGAPDASSTRKMARNGDVVI